MLQIKIEKKDFWLIAALMVFLVGVGYVIAVNPASKKDPGHDSTEIMININSVDKTLQQAIDEGDFVLGVEGTSCRTLISTDITSKVSWTEILVPITCRGRPCKLVAMALKNIGGQNKIVDIKFGDYYQTDDEAMSTIERWETYGQIGNRAGNNGDATDTDILTSFHDLSIKDDMVGTETDKSKWAYRDNSDSYGMILQACNY